MTQLVREYKQEDTMTQIEMKKTLSMIKLDSKKDPNNLLDKLVAIKCRYNINMDNNKKKAQVIRVRVWYSSSFPQSK
jgi:hypothetical protein